VAVLVNLQSATAIYFLGNVEVRLNTLHVGCWQSAL